MSDPQILVLRLNRRILIDNDPQCIATMNHRLGLAPANRSNA